MFIWTIQDIVGVGIIALVVIAVITLVFANAIINFVEKIKNKFNKKKEGTKHGNK